MFAYSKHSCWLMNNLGENVLMFCDVKNVIEKIKFIVRPQLLKSFFILVLKLRVYFGSLLIHIIYFLPDLFIVLPRKIKMK